MSRTRHKLPISTGSVSYLAMGPTSPNAGPFPVVILHGFSGSALAVTDLADRLATTHPVLVPDLPGHGHTEVGDGLASHTIAATAALVATLAGTTNGPVHLVGYSMGARTALRTALDHSDAVASLTTIGGTPGIDLPEQRAERVIADEALADNIVANGIEWFLSHWATLALWTDQPMRITAHALEELHHQSREADPRGLARSLRAMGTGAMEPMHHRLGELTCPTLVLAGDLDAKFTAIGQQMTEAISGASFQVVPHAGHRAHLNNPEFVAAAVLHHLSRAENP